MDSSVTRIIAVNGNNFDAGVALINPVARTAKTPSPQPPDLILQELVDLSPRLQSENRKYALELIARRVALNEECAALRAKIMEEVENDLAKRWEQAKKNCRDAETEIEKEKNRIAELNRDLNKAKQVLGTALADANNAKNERATVSRFSSVSSVKKKDEAIRSATSRIEKAQEETTRIQHEINSVVMVTLPALGKKFQQLCAAERRLCAALTGQAFPDEETGLPLIPGSF